MPLQEKFEQFLTEGSVYFDFDENQMACSFEQLVQKRGQQCETRWASDAKQYTLIQRVVPNLDITHQIQQLMGPCVEQAWLERGKGWGTNKDDCLDFSKSSLDYSSETLILRMQTGHIVHLSNSEWAHITRKDQ